MNNSLKLIGLIAVIMTVAFVWKYKQQTPLNPTGTVIILNGPSAAGKSSIQKEFQYLMMPNLWIKIGVDNLLGEAMPDINVENIPDAALENLEFLQTENPIGWVTTSIDQDNNPVVTISTGAQGDKVAYGMNSAIAAYAQNGCNIIVDYIAYKKAWLDDLQHKLKNIKTYWVKVSIPLEVLEAREVARATSPQGHARSHYHYVYWDIPYDLEVNSAYDSASQIAQQIKEKLRV